MNNSPHFAPSSIFACALAASLTAACASSAVTPAPLDPAASLSAYAGRTLDDPALREFLRAQGRSPAPWPLRQWTLDDLALAALHFHGDYHLALARQQAVAREAERDLQPPNPHLAVKAEHSNDPEVRRPWSLGLELGFPVRSAAAHSARSALATLRNERAAVDVTDTAWRLRAAVRDRLLDLAQADDDARLAAREHRLAAAEQSLLHRRAEAGAVSRAEAAAAAVRTADAAARLARAGARATHARIDLADAIGIAPDAARNLTAVAGSAAQTADPALPATLADYQQQALQQRQDIRAGLIDYAESEALVQIEATAGQDRQWTPGYKWDKGANVWSIGLALVLPLLHDNTARVAAAAAQRDVARRRFDAAQAHAVAQINAAWSDLGSQRSAHDAARAAHDASEVHFARERQRYEAGMIDRLEVTRSEHALATAGRTLVDARYALQRAWARAEDAACLPLGDAANAPGATFVDPSAIAAVAADGP